MKKTKIKRIEYEVLSTKNWPLKTSAFLNTQYFVLSTFIFL
jgi:hypothetical protein